MRLLVEKSRSRSGKHAARAMILIVSKQGVRLVEPERKRPTRPTYSVGEAYEAELLGLREDEYIVWAWFVRNNRGRVKGVFEVYLPSGDLVYRAVYRRLKIRRSMGDPRYGWIVKKAAEHLGIPVKRYNLGYKSISRKP